MTKIKGTRLSVYDAKDFFINPIKEFEDVDGWFINDYNDTLVEEHKTEPGFYLSIHGKKRDYGIVLSRSAILQMASEVRGVVDTESDKKIAYGQQECCGGLCGTNVE